MAKMFLGAGFAPISSSSAGYGQAISFDSYVPPMVTANYIDDNTKDFVLVDGEFVQVPEITDMVYLRLATAVDSSIDFALGNTFGDVKTYGTNSRRVLENKVIEALEDISDLIVVDSVDVSIQNGAAKIVLDYHDAKSGIVGRLVR